MRSQANSTLPMPYHRVQHSQNTAFSKLLRSVAVRGHPSLKLQISMNKQLNSVEAASDGESKVVHSPLAPNRKSGSRRMAFAPPPRWLSLHLSCVRYSQNLSLGSFLLRSRLREYIRHRRVVAVASLLSRSQTQFFQRTLCEVDGFGSRVHQGRGRHEPAQHKVLVETGLPPIDAKLWAHCKHK